MSVFDKFKVNPYVSTYAGAPIQEYKQTAGTLQQQMDKNLAAKDKIEILMSDIKAADVDKDFKAQKIAEYQKAIDAIGENPEYAQNKVRALSKEFAMDEDFKELQANQARLADMQSQIKEGDYSDFQLRKFTEELDRYRTPDEETGLSGLAAGRQMGDVNFYDEIAINEKVDDQVKGILETKFGTTLRDENGNLKEIVESEITEGRVAESVMGAITGNKQIARQVNDEAMQSFIQQKGRKPTREELEAESGEGGYSDFVNKYVTDTYIDPAIAKYGKRDEVTKLKTGGSGTGGSRYASQKNLPVSVIGAAASVVVDANYLGTEEFDENAAYDKITALRAEIDAGEFVNGSDVIVATNKLSILENSLQTVLSDPDSIEDAELRDLFANEENPSALWDLVSTPGNPESYEVAVSNAVNSLDSFELGVASYNDYYDAVQEQYNAIKEEHGKVVADRFRGAVDSGTLLAQATNNVGAKLIEEGVYGGPALIDFTKHRPEVQAEAKRIRDLNLSEARSEYSQNIKDSYDRPAAIKAYLLKNGYPEENIDYQVQKVEGIYNDIWYNDSYKDAVEDGLFKYTQNRNTIGIGSILPQDDQVQLSQAISSSFNTIDFDKSHFESLSVLEDNVLVPSDKTDLNFEDLDLNQLKIKNLDANGALGLLTVEIPSLESGKPSVTVALDLNSEVFTNAKSIIKNAATLKKQYLQTVESNMPGTQGQIDILLGVEAAYGTDSVYKDILQYSGLDSSIENAEKAISSSYIFDTLGAVYPMRNADGEIFFEQVNGSERKNLFLSEETFSNAALAYKALMEKAAEKHSTLPSVSTAS